MFGNVSVTFGMLGSEGKAGRLGSGIDKESFGSGMLMFGRLSETPGILGRLGRLGRLGSAMLIDNFGNGIEMFGSGGRVQPLIWTSMQSIASLHLYGQREVLTGNHRQQWWPCWGSRRR